MCHFLWLWGYCRDASDFLGLGLSPFLRDNVWQRPEYEEGSLVGTVHLWEGQQQQHVTAEGSDL